MHTGTFLHLLVDDLFQTCFFTNPFFPAARWRTIAAIGAESFPAN
jgi:hypothetical protein